ncbi:MAG: hypothetical protein ABIR27_07030 [Dokdonella sp.]
MKLWKLTAPILSALLCLASAMTSAANLVANPNFDTDVAGWTLDPGANGGAFALDSADGSPAAPSAFLQRGGSPVTGVKTGCIAVSSLQNIDMHADIKPSFQGFPARAQIIAYTFSDTSCSISMPTVIVTDACVALPAPGWVRCSTVNHSLAAGTQGVVLDISVSLTDANFDNIGFGPTGTVPVTLQSFNID